MTTGLHIKIPGLTLPSTFPVVENDAIMDGANDATVFLYDFSREDCLDKTGTGVLSSSNTITNLAASKSLATVSNALTPTIVAYGSFSKTSGGGLLVQGKVSSSAAAPQLHLGTLLQSYAYASGVEANQPDLCFSFWMRHKHANSESIGDSYYARWGASSGWRNGNNHFFIYLTSSKVFNFQAASDSTFAVDELAHIVISPKSGAYYNNQKVADPATVTAPNISQDLKLVDSYDWAVGDALVMYRIACEDLRASGRTIAEFTAAERAYFTTFHPGYTTV